MESITRLQASLTYGLLDALSRLPLPALYALSWLLRGAVYRVFRYRRATVRDHLASAWPQRSARARRQLERRFYRFLCDHLVENLYAARMPADELKRRVRMETPEEIGENGALLLFCHQGSLIWTLQRVALDVAVPLHYIHKPLRNAGAERFQERARSRFGSVGVLDREIGRYVLRQRRAGPRVVPLSLDHHPGAGASRCWCRFLGRETAFSDAARKAIRALGMPVFYVRVRRLRRGHYALRLERLGDPSGPGGDFALLFDYIARVERDIRAQPETWMWSMQRWKPTRRADEPLHEPPVPATGA